MTGSAGQLPVEDFAGALRFLDRFVNLEAVSYTHLTLPTKA